VLEDGSRFKGSIDMEVPKEMGGPARATEPSRTEPAPMSAGAAGSAGAATVPVAGGSGVKATA
jgi:hypothetical protein